MTLNDASSHARVRRIEDMILRETGNQYERLVALDAAALHRRLRCVRFSRRFSGDVDYQEERR